jgi:hypothetical protein
MDIRIRSTSGLLTQLPEFFSEWRALANPSPTWGVGRGGVGACGRAGVLRIAALWEDLRIEFGGTPLIS